MDRWRSFGEYGIEFNSELKEKIRKRDNYKCQKCKTYQKELYFSDGRKYKLIVHHIDRNKKNNNMCNLVSVCARCHRKLHNRDYNK